MLGDITLLPHANWYCPEAVNTLLRYYGPNESAEQMKKVENYGVTTMETFDGTTTDITLEYHQKWGCLVYMLDARLQNLNTTGLPKWDLHASMRIYLGNSPFHTSLVELISSPLNGHISPQYHVIFDDVLLYHSYGKVKLHQIMCT